LPPVVFVNYHKAVKAVKKWKKSSFQQNINFNLENHRGYTGFPQNEDGGTEQRGSILSAAISETAETAEEVEFGRVQFLPLVNMES